LSLLTPPTWGAAIDVYRGLGVSHNGPASQGMLVPRILVADDNTNIQKMVVLAFQERGIEVIAVGNGEAAVRRIPDSNPDLVLADVFMPVRNGYEVCEFVKKDARFSHIPVILLVGAFDPLDEKEARRVGADGVLKKPFVPPDPLIAMVMSALEKNPKVIAELAKAKEAKEAAAALAALPAAAMESPAKAEVKPLPEFPEPSPEEAAMIYGFGKGVRAIDAEEGEEDEPETKKSKSSQTLKDPQADKKSKTPAAAAPKTPVVQMEEEDEEVFDASATASDWRRNAADFEVPENIEANPIYSYGKNFEPITFPSERDVPPKRVRTDEGEEAAAPAPSAEAAPASASLDAPTVSDPSASWELTTDDELEAQHVESAKADEAAPIVAGPVESAMAEETPGAAVPQAQAKATETVSVQTPEPVAQTAAEAETAVAAVENKATAATEHESKESSRPSFVARVRGWMDMMSPSSDEHSETKSDEREQHWMTSLAAPTASNESLEVESTAISAPSNVTEIENPVQLAEAESLAETAPAPAITENSAAAENQAPTAEEGAKPVPEERFETAPMADLDAPLSGPGPIGGSDADAPTYEPEPVSVPEAFNEPEPVAKEEVAPPEPVHQHVNEQVHETVRAAAEESAPFITAEEPNQFEVAAQTRWTDSLPVSVEAQQNGSGASEHLPLEPMISHLHEQPFASASEPDQEPAHVAEWLRHRAHQADQSGEALPVENAESEPALRVWAREHHEPEYDEKPFADQPESSIFEPEPVQPAVQEFAERIPTMPPPNREALSQIPFLMPNPEREPVISDGTNAANSAAVDEVVRRVLEKLQPQLHELLSQGVKPLVENMLQHELKTELHKNEK
jgi:CheY-like chemotaxis protein